MATLDIIALRTFAAVSAFGGVRRAAQALHLSPAAVSAHVDRLERELGCRLIVPQGRGIGLTIDGEDLAARARVILQDHDDAVDALWRRSENQLYVAASEHAAKFLVPTVVSTLARAYPDCDIQLRLNRSERVRQFAEDSRADIALMLRRASRGGVSVAALPLQWFGTDNAARDRLIFFARPCAVRDSATTAMRGRPFEIVKEAADLSGVLTAAREGVGITPLPRMGPIPEGLRHIAELHRIASVNLYLATSDRIDERARAAVLAAMRQVLS